ncbi:hypothetical protein B0H17DRAFT_900630, partial [Mycena rosella]
EDVFLAGVRISLLAQADDLIVSLSVRGLRVKLSTLERWCAMNFILVNLIKTIILIFGPTLSPLPMFHLGSTQLTVKTDEKYVGINLRTDTRNILEDHYKAKARTARYCGHRIMAIEDMTGRLTPKELKQLYMARVDCHLIHGCEVSPDSEDVHVKQLCKVQVSFIRQMLNLHSRSMIAPLFTETGVMPLRVRRLLLNLSHLQYFLSLNDDTYARAALNSSIKLSGKGKLGDLIKVASRLPFHCPDLDLTRSTFIRDVGNYADLVQKLCMEWLQDEINSSEKLYLLHGRREPQKDKAPTQVTSYMRHHLSMPAQYQTAQTPRTRLSTHTVSLTLAVEVLRYVDHAYAPVPRSDRLCRFCKTDIEMPEHTLLTCQSSDPLVELR